MRYDRSASVHAQREDCPEGVSRPSPEVIAATAELKLAASYERQSKDNALGLDAQYEINAQAALKRGYVIPNSPEFRFQDNETQGSRTRRKGLDRCRWVVESGEAKFVALFCWEPERLTRAKDIRHRPFLEYRFLEFGVTVIYSTGAYNLDYQAGVQPEQMGLYVMEDVRNIQASAEVTKLVERIRQKTRTLICQGFFPGGGLPYAVVRWLADPRTRQLVKSVTRGESLRILDCRYVLRFATDESIEIVKELFRRMEAGGNVNAIVRWLTESKIPSPRGETWSNGAVRIILQNEIYLGNVLFGRARDEKGRVISEVEPVPYDQVDIEGTDPIRYDGFVPNAPISPEQFASVQEILRGTHVKYRQQRASSPVYVLTGKLECAQCGRPVCGMDKGTYYRHTPRTDCPYRCRSVRREHLEPAVFGIIESVLADEVLRDRIRQEMESRVRESSSEGQEVKMEAQREECRRLEKLAENHIRDRAKAGQDSAEWRLCNEAVKRACKELERAQTRLADLEGEHAKTLALGPSVLDVPDAQEILARLRTGSDEDRRRVVRTVIDCIRVDFNLPAVTVVVRFPKPAKSPSKE